MGIFLSVIGFLLVPTAIVWLIVNLFRKKKKLVPSLLIPAGIILCLTGLWIVGTNATPEELAALEQKKQEKAEAKLEAERLEKEKEEEEELKKLEKEELETAELAEEKRKEEEERNKEDGLKEQEVKQKQETAKKEEEEERITKKNVAEEKQKKTVAQMPKEDSAEDKARKIAYETFKFGKDPIDETVQEVHYDKGDKFLTVTVKGKDGWSDKWIRQGFYEDTSQAFRALSKDNRIDKIELNITFPMQDAYGNVSEDTVMTTVITRKELDKINWENFNTENLHNAAQALILHPVFQVY